MRRITQKDIEMVVERLNVMRGQAPEPFVNGMWNVGTYYISGAYGGWKLVRVANESGAESDPIGSGYVPRRQLYDLIQSYIRGVLDGSASARYS